MKLILICITLLTLLQWIEAEKNVGLVFPAPENQRIFSENNNKTNKTASQLFAPIRCLGCDGYCNSYEDGKDGNGQGNRMCEIEPGILHGCVSIFMHGLKRKCKVEMTMEENLYCKENANLCIECSDPDCNYVNLTANGLQASGSNGVRTSLILRLGSFLIAGLVKSKL